MSAVQAEASQQLPEESVSKPMSSKATRAYIVVGALALAILAGYFGYSWLTSSQVNTDNAQLEAEVVPMAAKVSGSILHLYVQDHQAVKKGDLLLELDPRDFEVRLVQAEAELEAARAQAESSPASSSGSAANAAQVMAARAEVTRADADVRKAGADLVRAQRLGEQKVITPVELENAQNAVDKARASKAQASARLKVAEEQHGAAEAKVKAAEAALKQAQIQLEYTKVFAPRDGRLSKVAVQEGQLIQIGQTIAQLVDHETFVVANFKETQIDRMRPGQRVEVEIDAYPGRHLGGQVESLAAATGARFSLLPPDNASGNFVKVVQRIPVKIKLTQNQAEDLDLSLKAGMSAEVTVYFK